ncbi:MAG: MarR family transcriptional regulator [archaeon]
MENKNVGYLILGIAAILVVIIFLFQNALKEIVAVGCDVGHGLECPMYDTINQQTWLALAIVGILIVISGFLIFSKQSEKIIVKKVKEKEKKKKINLDGLDKDEKKVVQILQEENNAMFQSALMEKLEIGKVKLTRLLDKLEAKQFIERKRRGMNNIVVLKS